MGRLAGGGGAGAGRRGGRGSGLAEDSIDGEDRTASGQEGGREGRRGGAW